MEKEEKIIVRVRAVIINDGKLLTVKHIKNTKFCALPGGHLEWKEGIRECLTREMVEELGVTPVIGRLLYIYNFTSEDSQSLEFFFEILNSDEYTKIDNIKRTHAYEITEIYWMETSGETPLRPNDVWEDFKKGEILSDTIKYIKN